MDDYMFRSYVTTCKYVPENTTYLEIFNYTVCPLPFVAPFIPTGRIARPAPILIVRLAAVGAHRRMRASPRIVSLRG